MKINFKIDIFKDYITLPGVGRKVIYQSSDINLLYSTKIYIIPINKILWEDQVFARYHEKGVTKIIKQLDKICEGIVGYDCNGLYS